MTPATQARERAGLTPEDAAHRARVSIGYLRQIERSGRDCSYPLATRLARIYGCNANIFITKTTGSQTPKNEADKQNSDVAKRRAKRSETNGASCDHC